MGEKSGTRSISHGQRELGLIILENLVLKGGKISFTAATGGCTDKSSFTVRVIKPEGFSEKIPHYLISIERTRIDECKAFLPEGEALEYDLKKDLGLKGDYTMAILNPIKPKT